MVRILPGDSSGTPKKALRLNLHSERSIVHSWQCAESIISLEHAGRLIFAGTNTGLIRIFDLNNYALIGEKQAHDGSVLVLKAYRDRLYSGSSDSLVKVWNLPSSPSKSLATVKVDLHLLHTIYSTFDIGEVFCLECTPLGLLYIGAQNASISWLDPQAEQRLASESSLSSSGEERDSPGPQHPAVRPNKFFDSAGPGGRLAPPQHRSKSIAHMYESDNTLISMPKQNRVNFAHNGYVYCLSSYQVNSPDPNADEKLRLVSGSSDGTIKFWDVNPYNGSLSLAHTLYPNNGAVLSLAIANKWELFCGLESGMAVSVDLETYDMVQYEVSKNEPLLTLIALDDVFIASSDAKVFEANARSLRSATWTADTEITAQTRVVDEKSRIVSSTRGGTVYLWEMSKSTSCVDQTDTCLPGLNDDAMISSLSKLVSLETVSGRERTHWFDSRECATYFKDLCSSFGATTHLIKVEDGNPIVYAAFKASNNYSTAPARVLFYGHYDVIEASTLWKTEPFSMVPENGYLYGRGVSDNKGPCLAALYAVAELSANGELACDVVFVIEGEEESGSFGFESAIRAHKQIIGPIDWILFSNSYWIDDTRPCLNYGLRGIVSVEITVQSDEHDAHSGVVGGVYREPVFDLIHLLGCMSSSKGEITIPGFFENVLPVSYQERKLYAKIEKYGSSMSRIEDILARWRFPSLTVHSIDVSGPKNKTVIPSKVTAAASIRIVPNQTAEEVIKKVKEHLNASFDALTSPNHLEINIKYSAEPWLGDPSNQIFKVLKKAVQREWDIDPLFVREGGSIPMARKLEQIFDAQAAHLPVGQSSDNAHLDNERLRVKNLLGARRILHYVFRTLKPRSE